MIVMCQCRFISGDQYSTLVGDVDSGGGGYIVWGQGGYGNSLYFPLDFAVNLKLL